MQRQLILMLLVAIILILITVQNPNPVSLQFLSWEAQQVPLIIIILISALTGMVLSLVLGLFQQSKMKATIRQLQAEVEDLQQPSVISLDEETEE